MDFDIATLPCLTLTTILMSCRDIIFLLGYQVVMLRHAISR